MEQKKKSKRKKTKEKKEYTNSWVVEASGQCSVLSLPLFSSFSKGLLSVTNERPTLPLTKKLYLSDEGYGHSV